MLWLVNKLELDSNIGKIGSSSARQIFFELELGLRKLNERTWTS